MKYSQITEDDIKKIMLLAKVGTLEKWEFLPGGIHLNIRFTNTDSKTYVLKIPLGKMWNSASHQFEVCKFLYQNTTLPVPRPYFYDGTCKIIPRPYFLMQFLPGENPLLVHCNTIEGHEDLYVEMGKNLCSLHIQSKMVSNKWQYDKISNWREYLKSLTAEHLSCCETILPLEIIKKMKNILNQSFGIVPEFIDMAMLHRDFKMQNILIDETWTICGIIDFEWAHWGDPLFDLASTECYLNDNEKMIFHGYFDNDHMDKFYPLFCLYNIINLIHVLGRSTYVLQGAAYFAITKLPYLEKILAKWNNEMI